MEAEALSAVRGRIAAAEAAAGRLTGSVRLIAVSKTFDASAIRPVIAGGQRVFGENRVQEAAAKWPALRIETPGIALDLIGPLQSNKAKASGGAVRRHPHHRPRQDRCGDSRGDGAAGSRLRLMVQVNTGAEPQKAGVKPEEADAFVERCRTVHGLAIDGLMCIPPFDEVAAPHFALLAKIARAAGSRSRCRWA